MKTRQFFDGCSKLLLIPFAVCVLFLRGLGLLCGLNYKQISVIFNLYLQGGLLCLTGVLPFAATVAGCFVCRPSWGLVALLLALAFYACLHIVGLVWLIRHYKLPCNDAFDRCVADLQWLGRKWNMSYYAVNLIIFVAGWLSFVIINLYLAYAIAGHGLGISLMQ